MKRPALPPVGYWGVVCGIIVDHNGDSVAGMTVAEGYALGEKLSRAIAAAHNGCMVKERNAEYEERAELAASLLARRKR